MGCLDQVVQWIGLALLLFLCPILVTKYRLRDPAKWKPKRFWIFASFAVTLSVTFVWHHELDHWFSYDLENETEKLIFGAIVMVPILVLSILATRRSLRKWLGNQSRGFRFCIGIILVGLMAFGAVWLLEEEGEELLSFDGFLTCSLVGLGIYIFLSLLWNIVGRFSVEHRVAAARLLFLCYLSSVILLGFMSKLFYEEEKYWVGRNELWRPDLDYPTQVWRTVLPKIKKEHRELFESLPEIGSED